MTTKRRRKMPATGGVGVELLIMRSCLDILKSSFRVVERFSRHRLTGLMFQP